jgi:hypothetical protein
MGEAHNGLLPSVCIDPFLSMIRVWTLEGDVVYTLSDHKLNQSSEPSQKAFIYSLSVLPSGVIASAGEDYAVSVWRGEFYIPLLSSCV